ncbi:hypothetical protein VTN49DRAFT_7840 [Thermomyces lanuginosus]|uniref:uncharacterized protein n=1 Tax=Thermomyces lanuginosus TaxID=5541 RepID=UPI00374223B1
MKRSASPGVSPPPVKRKVESTTTKAAIASFFTPASQKKPEKITWRIVNKSLIVGKYDNKSTSEQPERRDEEAGKKRRIAAFDLDSTLITTASGNRFARNARDWKWWHTSVPDRLRELTDKGYIVVVISNQKKVSLKNELKGGQSESKSLSNFKEMTTAVMRQLDIPLSIYAATQYDDYRKPRTGMWKEFLDDYDLDIDDRVDLEGSVFVGDAAGRQGDHSCVDRDFAANVGIPFKTPEEFFLNASPEQVIREFDPAKYIQEEPDSAAVPTFSKLHPQELVIFCGSPGAGKSTFYWRYLQPQGYERINQDTLKSRANCIKAAKERLQEGSSVAVDNTNPSTEVRKEWIDLARSFKIPARCVHFTAPAALCRHNDAVRAANPSLNPEHRPPLPGMAFIDFQRRYEEPKLEEGFEDITRVDFVFRGTEEEKAIWKNFWV